MTETPPFNADDRLREGQAFRAVAGRNDISLVPGALIEAAPQTELRLERLRLTKNGNRVEEAVRRDIALALRRGRLAVSIQFPVGDSAVEIHTPGGVVFVRSPALFAITADGEKTRVTCARGALEWRAPGKAKPALLNGPTFQDWPEQTNSNVPAQFDPVVAEEIENLREVEQKLLGLEDRRRLARYPWRQ